MIGLFRVDGLSEFMVTWMRPSPGSGSGEVERYRSRRIDGMFGGHQGYRWLNGLKPGFGCKKIDEKVKILVNKIFVIVQVPRNKTLSEKNIVIMLFCSR